MIADFEHEEGYEYKLKVRKIPYSPDWSLLQSSHALTMPPKYVYALTEIISKVEKENSLDS